MILVYAALYVLVVVPVVMFFRIAAPADAEERRLEDEAQAAYLRRRR